MNRKLFKKEIQRMLSTIADKYGWETFEKMVLIKQMVDMIGIICCDFTPTSMHLYFAIQPLFFPCENLVFTLGYRAKRPDIEIKGQWGSDECNLSQDILEINNVICKQGIPFVESFSSPGALVEKISTNTLGDIVIPENKKNQYLGFALLRTQQYEMAIAPLSKALDALRLYNTKSTNKMSDTIHNLLELIQDQRYDEIDSYLDKVSAEVGQIFNGRV